MKIVLVAPIMYLNPPDIQPHVGLSSLKAILAQHDYRAEIISLNPQLTDTYDSYRYGKSSISQDFYQEALDLLLATEADLIGFSTVGSSYPTTLLLAKKLKAARPNLTIVLGGIQASLCAEETLRHFTEVDYIVAGEAELTFPVFLKHLQAGTPFPPSTGIYYRSNTGDNASTAQISYTGDAPLLTDLDTLPLMDYQDIDMAALLEVKIDVGRGCPFQCYYCCTNNYWRRTYRLRSAKNIVDEIEYVYKTYGNRLFAFNHDLLTCNRTVFKELLQTLKERKLPIRWKCSSRIDTIDTELLREMAETGCYQIFLGIETGSPRMQKVIKKNLDLTKILPLLEEALKLKINCITSFICGMPEETMDDLIQTLDLAHECVARYAGLQIHLLAPFQGTEIYRQYRDQLRFDGKSSNVGSSLLSNPLEEELIKAHPDMFCNFYYIENPYMSREKLRNIEQFPLVLHYFWRTIGVLRHTHSVGLGDILTTFLEKPVQLPELPDFIESIVDTVEEPSQLLQDVFAFELALHSTYNDLLSPVPSNTVQIEDYFHQQVGSKLYPLSFEPTILEKSILEHNPAGDINEGQPALAALMSATYQNTLPQYTVVPAQSSPVSIYNQADGTLRVQDIIEDATRELQNIMPPEQVEERITNLFKQFQAMRLVTFNKKER